VVAAGAAVTAGAGVGPDGVEVGPAVVTAGVVGSVAVTSVGEMVVGSVVVPGVPARRAAPSCAA
jgi:hypothetical protein